jgi:hypothetical protein
MLARKSEMEAQATTGRTRRPKDGRDANYREQTLVSELLVVADKQFLDYYANTDPETYILTIMNMVADIFHYASVGNLLDIVVVRIIYLQKQEDDSDLHIKQDAHASLDSFCK